MGLIQFAPFALQAVRQRQAEDEAQKTRDLQRLMQSRADDRADLASRINASSAFANQQLTQARTKALENPKQTFKYVQDADGNFFALPATTTMNGAGLPIPGPSVTPSANDQPQGPQTPPQGPSITPVSTGIKGAPKFNPANSRTKANFKLNGADVAGSVDKQGNYYDAQGNRVSGKVTPYAPPVNPSYAFPTVAGPDGTPVVARANTKTGQIETTDIGGKPSTGQGSASLSPEDRQRMINQARLDNQTMKAYEQKVLDKKAHVGAAKGIAGAMAQGGTGVMGQIGSIVGNTAVGMSDPEYQKYITAQRSYGRIMGNLQSKRYTDHQAEIERSISGIQGNDLNSTIQYKQNLRDASLADVLGSPGGGRGGAGAPTHAPQHDPGGNIDLTKTPPKAAPKKGGKDYGIFSGNPDDE